MFRMFENKNESETTDTLNKDRDCYSRCKEAQAILIERVAYISISSRGDDRDTYGEEIHGPESRYAIDAAIKTMDDCAATCPEFDPYEAGNGPKSFR